MKMNKEKKYVLMDQNGHLYTSLQKGKLGGNKRNKIYGLLDCPSALRALKKGIYQKNRVFFSDEKTAILAGYRPCAVCMPKEYQEWKKGKKGIK